jgi:hypothetical protein
MEKKSWNAPEILELGVENTEYGNSITNNIDATYNDGKHTFWSFS